MTHQETETRDQHPEGLTPAQERLSLKLFEIGAVKFGEFRLKLHDTQPEAPLSPIYIDLRVLKRDPETKGHAIGVYKELVDNLEYDLLADIPTAATPLVSSLSDALWTGMISPRPDTKAHGTGAKIEGMRPEDKGKTVLLVDDLVTKAKSSVEAIHVLRQNGLVVNDLVVLIDREQGGRKDLEEERVNLHAAFTMKQMLNFYVRVGEITQVEYDRIQQGLGALNDYLAAGSS